MSCEEPAPGTIKSTSTLYILSRKGSCFHYAHIQLRNCCLKNVYRTKSYNFSFPHSCSLSWISEQGLRN